MPMTFISNLTKLYYRPLDAMSSIIDTGEWLPSVILVFIISLCFHFTIVQQLYNHYEAVVTQQVIPIHNNLDDEDEEKPAAPTTRPQGTDTLFTDNSSAPRLPRTTTIETFRQAPLPVVGLWGWWLISFSLGSSLATVISLAFVYIPIIILLMTLFEPLGSFSVVLRRDYGPMLCCGLMAWAAAHIPFTLLGLAAKPLNIGDQALFGLWLLSKLVFGLFLICALRVIFSASYSSALGTISLCWLAGLLQSTLASLLFISPFFIFWIYMYTRGDINVIRNDIGSSFRRRQSLRRSLEAATINPKDAEAHYQIGLIHLHRHQYSEAISRFQKAIEIDKREVDAHFQLGRIARQQGRLQEAINLFDVVVQLDDKYSLSDIWREIGATYEAANMLEDAHVALLKFTERRPYDGEGLYYLGCVLVKMGQLDKARETFKQSVESVETAPYYRRRLLLKWRKLAAEKLRNLA